MLSDDPAVAYRAKLDVSKIIPKLKNEIHLKDKNTMNLIALVTLTKLIKLELIALYYVVSQNDNYTSKAYKTKAENLYQSVYDYVKRYYPWQHFWGVLNPFYTNGITIK